MLKLSLAYLFVLHALLCFSQTSWVFPDFQMTETTKPTYTATEMRFGLVQIDWRNQETDILIALKEQVGINNVVETHVFPLTQTSDWQHYGGYSSCVVAEKGSNRRMQFQYIYDEQRGQKRAILEDKETGFRLVLDNSAKLRSEVLYYIDEEAQFAQVYINDNTNTLQLGEIKLTNQSGDSAHVLYTSAGTLFKQHLNETEVNYPINTTARTLLCTRKIAENITKNKEGVFTYVNDIHHPLDENYGMFTTHPAGFEDFRYTWILPATIKPIDYSANVSGEWKLNNQVLTFVGGKGVNNILVKIDFKKVPKPAPQQVEGTNVRLVNKIVLTGDEVKVKMWDSGKEDGDVMSLYLNGQLWIKDFQLKNCPAEFSLQLPPGDSYLVMKSVSEGTLPPTTATFMLESTGFRREISLSSDPGTSEMVEFHVPEETN